MHKNAEGLLISYSLLTKKKKIFTS